MKRLIEIRTYRGGGMDIDQGDHGRLIVYAVATDGARNEFTTIAHHRDSSAVILDLISEIERLREKVKP